MPNKISLEIYFDPTISLYTCNVCNSLVEVLIPGSYTIAGLSIFLGMDLYITSFAYQF